MLKKIRDTLSVKQIRDTLSVKQIRDKLSVKEIRDTLSAKETGDILGAKQIRDTLSVKQTAPLSPSPPGILVPASAVPNGRQLGMVLNKSQCTSLPNLLGVWSMPVPLGRQLGVKQVTYLSPSLCQYCLRDNLVLDN